MAVATQEAAAAVVDAEQLSGLRRRLASVQAELRSVQMTALDEATQNDERVNTALAALDHTSTNFEMRVASLEKQLQARSRPASDVNGLLLREHACTWTPRVLTAQVICFLCGPCTVYARWGHSSQARM